MAFWRPWWGVHHQLRSCLTIARGNTRQGCGAGTPPFAEVIAYIPTYPIFDILLHLHFSCSCSWIVNLQIT